MGQFQQDGPYRSSCIPAYKQGDSDHFEDVVMWFADNIKPFYNGTFPIWSKIQSELK